MNPRPEPPRALLHRVIHHLSDPGSPHHQRYASLIVRWTPEALEDALYGCMRREILRLFEDENREGYAHSDTHAGNGLPDAAGAAGSSVEEDTRAETAKGELDFDADLDGSFDDDLSALCATYDALSVAAPPDPPPAHPPKIISPHALYTLQPFPDPAPVAGVYLHIIHPGTARRSSHESPSRFNSGSPSSRLSTPGQEQSAPGPTCYLYTGQSNTLSRRRDQHRDFRYRRENRSLHYAAVEESSADRFMVMTTRAVDQLARKARDTASATAAPRTPSPKRERKEETPTPGIPTDEPGDVAPEEDDRNLLLNILELYTSLLFQTAVAGASWPADFGFPTSPSPQVPPQTARPAGLNVASPLVQSHRRPSTHATASRQTTPFRPRTRPSLSARALSTPSTPDREYTTTAAAGTSPTSQRSTPDPTPSRAYAHRADWHAISAAASDGVIRAYALDQINKQRAGRRPPLMPRRVISAPVPGARGDEDVFGGMALRGSRGREYLTPVSRAPEPVEEPVEEPTGQVDKANLEEKTAAGGKDVERVRGDSMDLLRASEAGGQREGRDQTGAESDWRGVLEMYWVTHGSGVDWNSFVAGFLGASAIFVPLSMLILRRMRR